MEGRNTMSSRKEVENHNMFQDNEFQKSPKDKKYIKEEYAMDEKMTIPDFDNQVVKDSAWQERKDTR